MEEDKEIDPVDYLKKTFIKLAKENEREDIKPEQYIKNIEVMLLIYRTFEDYLLW